MGDTHAGRNIMLELIMETYHLRYMALLEGVGRNRKDDRRQDLYYKCEEFFQQLFVLSQINTSICFCAEWKPQNLLNRFLTALAPPRTLLHNTIQTIQVCTEADGKFKHKIGKKKNCNMFLFQNCANKELAVNTDSAAHCLVLCVRSHSVFVLQLPV